MAQNDPRLNSRRGPEGLPEGGRIRRPTRAEEARLERLSAYLDGWTTDRERAAVEREIASDDAARADLADLRLVRTALANLEMPRAPRSFALLAPPRRRPVALFRRMEWATRGAAGVAALAFAFALLSGPGASETVTGGMPAATNQERASASAAADSAAPAASSAKARETATQTLDLAPAGVGLGSAAPQVDAIGTPPAAGVGGAVSPSPSAPAPVPPSAPSPSSTATPAAAGAQTTTPTPEPRSLLAPAPAGTPQAATTGVSPTPTVEATRLGASTPEATATPPDAVRATTPAPTAAAATVGSANTESTPPLAATPGTLPAPVASDERSETSAVPALGILALLLGLLAIIERAGTRTGRA